MNFSQFDKNVLKSGDISRGVIWFFSYIIKRIDMVSKTWWLRFDKAMINLFWLVHPWIHRGGMDV